MLREGRGEVITRPAAESGFDKSFRSDRCNHSVYDRADGAASGAEGTKEDGAAQSWHHRSDCQKRQRQFFGRRGSSSCSGQSVEELSKNPKRYEEEPKSTHQEIHQRGGTSVGSGCLGPLPAHGLHSEVGLGKVPNFAEASSRPFYHPGDPVEGEDHGGHAADDSSFEIDSSMCSGPRELADGVAHNGNARPAGKAAIWRRGSEPRSHSCLREGHERSGEKVNFIEFKSQPRGRDRTRWQRKEEREKGPKGRDRTLSCCARWSLRVAFSV